jgi:hypothetical protein
MLTKIYKGKIINGFFVPPAPSIFGINGQNCNVSLILQARKMQLWVIAKIFLSEILSGFLASRAAM